MFELRVEAIRESIIIFSVLYSLIFLIFIYWHSRIGIECARGLEIFTFFLSLDISLATGRVTLSCFLPSLIIDPWHRQVCFAVAAFGTLLVAMVSGDLQGRPSTVRNATAWALRVVVTFAHSLLLIGIHVSEAPK